MNEGTERQMGGYGRPIMCFLKCKYARIYNKETIYTRCKNKKEIKQDI